MDTKSQQPAAAAPIRRSRLVYLLGAALLFFVGYQAWIGLPQSKPVTEIYGFLHLVSQGATAEGEQLHSFKQMEDVDWKQPVSLDTYAVDNVNINWNREMKRIDDEFPIIVFSKTYCPFSKRAKALLSKYDLNPKVKVVEVDLRDDAPEIKQLLTRLTQHSTFPNILIRGQSIGGADNLAQLHNEHTLQKLLQDGGVRVGNIDY